VNVRVVVVKTALFMMTNEVTKFIPHLVILTVVVVTIQSILVLMVQTNYRFLLAPLVVVHQRVIGLLFIVVNLSRA